MSLPPRSVWVDAQGAQSSLHPERGISRHIAEIVSALLEVAPEAVGAVGLNPALPNPVGLNRLEGSSLVRTPAASNGVPPELPLVYHLPSPFEGVRLERMWPCWARRGIRTVVTVHDLVPLLFPEIYFDSHPHYAAFYQGRLGLIREADRVLAISQCSAADAVKHLGIDERRITVIDSGVTSELASLAPTDDAAVRLLRDHLPGVRDGFLLYVGGEDWRKNLDGMVNAYGLLPDELRRRHQLVIACRLSDQGRRDLLSRAERAGIRPDDLVLTGFVSDPQLAALYRACHLFVFPTFYEGAGLPILEAMSCGAPVIGAEVASVPEVLGDLRGTFDSHEPRDIAACIQRTVDDPAELELLRERSDRRAAHFTWERVARLTLEGYEAALLAPARRQAERPRRTRLAILTNWPPDPGSGLDPDLIARLADRADVDVIAPTHADRPAAPERTTLRQASELEWVHALREYDRFLYVLDETPASFHALDALMRRPGLVIANADRLGELFRRLYRERYADDPIWLRETYEEYGERLLGPDADRAENGDAEAGFERFMRRLMDVRAERVVDPSEPDRVVELLS